MDRKDLASAVTLFLDANKFAKKKDILKWTGNGLKRFPKYHLVYEMDGEIIGAISGASYRKKLAQVDDIAVDGAYRGKGVGGKLLYALLSRFRQDGIAKVSLWVHWTDAGAIPFYYHHGFRLKAFKRTHGISGVPDGEDVLILERDI
jgi:ribosomal protein S18 acetylase RimI-like enzyme